MVGGVAPMIWIERYRGDAAFLLCGGEFRPALYRTTRDEYKHNIPFSNDSHLMCFLSVAVDLIVLSLILIICQFVRLSDKSTIIPYLSL